MTDYTLAVFLRQTLLAYVPVPGLTVKRSNQPTDQGAVSGPALYFFKVTERTVGQPRRRSFLEGGQMRTTLHQRVEATYQVTARWKESPTEPERPSASDLAAMAVMAIAGHDSVADAAAAGIGILRIGEVRNPPFMGDGPGYDFDPSFDVTFTTARAVLGLADEAHPIEFEMHRV